MKLRKIIISMCGFLKNIKNKLFRRGIFLSKVKHATFTFDEKYNSAIYDLENGALKNLVVASAKNARKILKDFPEAENYFYYSVLIDGQRIDFALVKDGRPGPHDMRKAAEKELEKYKEN